MSNALHTAGLIAAAPNGYGSAEGREWIHQLCVPWEAALRGTQLEPDWVTVAVRPPGEHWFKPVSQLSDLKARQLPLHKAIFSFEVNAICFCPHCSESIALPSRYRGRGTVGEPASWGRALWSVGKWRQELPWMGTPPGGI